MENFDLSYLKPISFIFKDKHCIDPSHLRPPREKIITKMLATWACNISNIQIYEKPYLRIFYRSLPLANRGFPEHNFAIHKRILTLRKSHRGQVYAMYVKLTTILFIHCIDPSHLQFLPASSSSSSSIPSFRFAPFLLHCCYQVAFQEINILFNRAHLVNCNYFLTESLYEKNYFSKTIKVKSSLTNILGTVFSGQTYVQTWLLNYGHIYGWIWPFLTLMAIFTHQTAGIIAIIWPIVAHGGGEDSHKKFPFALLKWPMPY